MKLFHKNYVFLFCLFGLALLSFNSVYAQTECKVVDDFVNEEKLKRYIFYADEVPFATITPEISDETLNKQIDECWREGTNCTEGKENCAEKLGTLFAEFALKIEDTQYYDKLEYHQKLAKLITFINSIMGRFGSRDIQFYTAYRKSYHSFIAQMASKFDDYKKLSEIVTKKSLNENGDYRADAIKKKGDDSKNPLNQFPRLRDKINDAIKGYACQHIDKIVDADKLESYAFDNNQKLPFPKTPEKGEVKDAVEAKWNGGKAEELGKLLADIALKIENENYPATSGSGYHQKFKGLITLTDELLKKLEEHGFTEAYGKVYHSFVTGLSSKFSNHMELKEIVSQTDLSGGGKYWAENYTEAKERFPNLKAIIEKSQPAISGDGEGQLTGDGGGQLTGDAEGQQAGNGGKGNRPIPVIYFVAIIFLVIFCGLLYLSNRKLGKEVRMATNDLKDLKNLPANMAVRRLEDHADALSREIDELEKELSKKFVKDSAIDKLESIEKKFDDLKEGVEKFSPPEHDPVIRRKHKKLSDETVESLNKRIADLKAQISQKTQANHIVDDSHIWKEEIKGLQETVEQIQKDLAQLKNTPAGPNIKEFNVLKGMVGGIQKALKEQPQREPIVSKKPPETVRQEAVPPKDAIFSAIIEMEKSMLLTKWERFEKEHKDVFDLSKETRDSEELKFYLSVLSSEKGNLPKLLAADPDEEKLVSLYNDISLQLKEHYPQLIKLPIIDRFAEGKLKRQEDPEKELSNLRAWSQLLTSLEDNPRQKRRLLDFNLSRWIREHFLEIADKVLLRYHETKPDKRAESLNSLHETVLRVLKQGNLRPVEIVPGQTPFDSNLHIARSTINDPSQADKVIVEVQRNGFMLGKRVIQQPQVIINKT